MNLKMKKIKMKSWGIRFLIWEGNSLECKFFIKALTVNCSFIVHLIVGLKISCHLNFSIIKPYCPKSEYTNQNIIRPCRWINSWDNKTKNYMNISRAIISNLFVKAISIQSMITKRKWENMKTWLSPVSNKR